MTDAISLFLTFGLPVLLGIVAIVHWVRTRQSILRGLGLVFKVSILRDLVAGLLITFLGMLGIFLVELLLNVIQVTAQPVDVGRIGSAAGMFVFGAVYEEVFFRALKGNKWAAIIISAVIFGFAHILNPNATLITAFGTGLGGLIYGIAFLGAQNIWLPLGLHFNWNFAQAMLGFPVSGLTFDRLLTTTAIGPELLTGGAYGPEAGLVGMVFRFVIIGMVFFYLSRVTKTKPGNPRILEYDL
jgi:membrane protease YdiL (CAAX protease family)